MTMMFISMVHVSISWMLDVHKGILFEGQRKKAWYGVEKYMVHCKPSA